jgi:ABC-type transporter Mla subunit MlaD
MHAPDEELDQALLNGLVSELESAFAYLGQTSEAAADLLERAERLGERLTARLAPMGGILEQGSAWAAEQVDALSSAFDALDTRMQDIAERIDEARLAAKGAFPTQRFGELVEALRQVVAESQNDVRAALTASGEQIVEAFGASGDDVEQKREELRGAAESFEGQVSSQLDDFLREFETLFVEPLHTAAGALDGRVEAAVEDRLVQPLLQEGERINEALGESLAALLDDLMARLYQLLAEVRERLVDGDSEAGRQRELISAAIDELEVARPPLEAAFDAFRSLAGTVGVSV